MVRLPGGAEVPESFTAEVVLLEKGLRWVIRVVMIDGRPHAREVLTRSTKPMPAETLRSIDLVAVLDAAVQHMAWTQAFGDEVAVAIGEISQPGGEEHFIKLLDAEDDFLKPARAARRRNTVTPEHLSHVLELYEKGGVRLVMEELAYTERHARRLLARARKEIPQ